MSQKNRFGKSRRGSITVLAAVLMVLLLAVVAFALDYGNVCRVKTQTQAVADAAALAGAQQLSAGTSAVEAAAIAAAKANTANGQSVTLTNSNIVLGTWSTSALTFTPVSGSTVANAVQVTVSLSSAGGNAVSTFFARIFGDNTVNVTSSAIAAGGRWDVVVVIDRSSSFSADIAQGIAGVQQILTLLDTYSPTSNFGMVTFDGVAYTNASLQAVGANYSSLQSTINSIQDCSVGGPACSGSDLAAGMAGGIALFSASGYSPPVGTRKAIFFISDGAASVTSQCLNKSLSDTQDNTLTATEASNAWKNNGISVFSLLYYHGSDSSIDTNAMAAVIQGAGTFVQEATAAQLTADLQSMFLNGLSMSLVQ